MDVLTQLIQGEVAWCMLFVDDIVLIETRSWDRVCGVKFSDVPSIEDVEVRLDSQVIWKGVSST